MTLLATRAKTKVLAVDNYAKEDSKEDCKPRPFDKEGIDFTYVKHMVLQPESGVFDRIGVF